MMEIANVSFPEVFILLGFSERPSLEPILFIFVLGIYVVSVLGNGVIIVVSCMDVHLHTPMYFFLSFLSFVDICYSSVTAPKLIIDFQVKDKRVSCWLYAPALFLPPVWLHRNPYPHSDGL